MSLDKLIKEVEEDEEPSPKNRPPKPSMFHTITVVATVDASYQITDNKVFVDV